MDAMEQRRNAIVDFINKEGSITFSQLEKKFTEVSQMTLRTDLKALDEAKRIVRVHGGAKSVEVVLGTDDFIGLRSVRNVEAKEEIARKTLELIRPNQTVYLDSGSTATALARIWPDQQNFIFTNSLECIMELAKLKNPKVLVPGGELNQYSLSMCGEQATDFVKRVNFDLAIIGVTCYSADTGFSCGVLNEAYLKHTVMKQAEQSVILMDSSKVDKKKTFQICSLNEVDIVVADQQIAPSFVKECKNAGVTLL